MQVHSDQDKIDVVHYISETLVDPLFCVQSRIGIAEDCNFSHFPISTTLFSVLRRRALVSSIAVFNYVINFSHVDINSMEA